MVKFGHLPQTEEPKDIRGKIKAYRAKNHRRTMFLVAIVVAIVVLAIYSCSISTLRITFSQAATMLYKAICGIPMDAGMEKTRWTVMSELCVPRTIAAILIGASLAVGGAVMQSITRNSLTDSYTIGISSAAMFGVTIGIVYGVCVIPVFNGDMAAIVNAFMFALIPSAAIIFVSSFKKMSATMMILIGIGIMYVFNAFSTFVKFNASAESLTQIYEKSVGTLTDITWSAIAPLIAGTVVIVVVSMVIANRINVMGSGDNMAKALGVQPVMTRVICFVAISVSTGVCVAYTGTIGFVGLVAPHIARLFVGSDNRILIPSSAIIGALLILVADVLVRKLPGGLPVGVVTAAIGAPIFIYVLYRQRKNAAF